MMQMTRDRRGIALLIAACVVGMFLRLAWALSRTNPSAGEAQNVATAFAQGRGFADAYFVGAGPTAHLLPTMPLLSGIVYAVFGVQSTLSETILQLFVFVVLGVAYALLVRLFDALGSPRAARISAIVFLCLVPLFLGQETLDFRYWEGGLACVAGFIALNHVVILAVQRLPLSPSRIVMIAAIFATTFVISPAVGFAAGSAYGVVLMLRYPLRAYAPVPIAAIAVTALVLTPWAIRNYHIFGKPIVLRSNAPLELSIANNDLVARSDTMQAFYGAMAHMHPTFSKGPAAAEVRRIGEIAYMDRLSVSTSKWIHAHPGDFARLCARHFRQIFFPDDWQFQIGSGRMSAARATIFSLLSALAFMGLVWRLNGRNRIAWGAVGVYIAVLALSYLPFQPVVRYMYLFNGLLTFLAFDFIVRAFNLFGARDTSSTSLVEGAS